MLCSTYLYINIQKSNYRAALAYFYNEKGLKNSIVRKVRCWQREKKYYHVTKCLNIFLFYTLLISLSEEVFFINV